MLSAGAALIGIIVGAAGGVGRAPRLVALARERRAGRSASGCSPTPSARPRRRRREAQVDAREQAVALRSEIEREIQDRRVEIAKIEERMLQKELEVDARLDGPRAQGAGAR